MKRILTIQDISCVGRCSLTVALPIISAAGVEAAILPTAVLSTHTAFPAFTFKDLTDDIEPITETFKELKLDFDAVYTGYLGSKKQLELVADVFEDFKVGTDKKPTLKIVDPVMADNGKFYKGFDQAFANDMAKLCDRADLILPNLTEAAFLLDTEYTAEPTEEKIKEMLKKLTANGTRAAAFTGISFKKNEIGFYLYDSNTDSFSSYFNEKLPVSYHGTGDIFASAATGAIMRGLDLHSALCVATDFTKNCIQRTLEDEERRFYGVNFESELAELPKLIADRAN